MSFICGKFLGFLEHAFSSLICSIKLFVAGFVLVCTGTQAAKGDEEWAFTCALEKPLCMRDCLNQDLWVMSSSNT